MELRKIGDRETIALVASLALVLFVFSFSAYHNLVPKQKTWESEIFETWTSNGRTHIRGYEVNRLVLDGEYELDVGSNYRITYIQQGKKITEVLSIEEL
jgi:hypothetical protein